MRRASPATASCRDSAVGEIVRDLVMGREPFVDVAPLSVERFGAPPCARSSTLFDTGAVVVQALEALGVDSVFGLPGVHNLPIWDRCATGRCA